MAINPQVLAAVMQRMQPQGMNAPVPPSAPPPGGPMPGPGMQAAPGAGAPQPMQNSPGMPVQMQGTMMMKPAAPPQGMAPGGPPPMQRRF